MTGIKPVGWLALFCLGAGCDAVETLTESPADKVVRMKVERLGILDALYAEYGGSDIANATTTAAKEVEAAEGNNPLVDMFAGAVSESDRELFDANCELIGSGERSTAFSSKARDFFAKEDVKAKCMKVGSLGREIQKLRQGEVGGTSQ